MSLVLLLLQILIAVGLLNVWIIRSGRPTRYRGAGAQTMTQEFLAYGLPLWSVYVVGFFKIAIAIIMISGLYRGDMMSSVGVGALGILSILMIGALVMHTKVRDKIVRMLPALGMLAMAVGALVIVLLVR